MNLNIELTMFEGFDGLQITKTLNKLVIWKNDSLNPLALPQITLTQISTILNNYFSRIVVYDPIQNATLLNNFNIGDGNNTNLFLSTWSLNCKSYIFALII